SDYPDNRLLIQPEVRRNEVLSFLRGNVNEVLNKRVRVLQEIEINSPVEVQSESEEDLFVPAGRAWAEEAQFGCLQDGTIALSGKKELYVPGALKDLSISRTSFKWGIPVPGNEKHVIYVWLDALANYMTAIGYGSDDPIEQEKFKRYWPADLHLVGKEIIRFHCVYWPAFLLAANLPLPKAITAHGWLLFEDSKMSKSRGNIVRTETILDAFGNLVYATMFPNSTHSEQDLFASDVLRYFLLREIPFGQDGSFSFDALWNRYNSELTNGYGNLVSRTLNMIDTNCTALIPEPPHEMIFRGIIENGQGGFLQTTDDLRIVVRGNVRAYKEFIETCDFSIAVSAPVGSIAATDRYISDHAPWKLAKAKDETSRQKLHEVLYTAAESIRIITALLYPILPYATAKVWAQLGLGDIEA
ncbi:MAG: class I tRNA ligase family protein, partial [Edaphobacter sp.]